MYVCEMYDMLEAWNMKQSTPRLRKRGCAIVPELQNIDFTAALLYGYYNHFTIYMIGFVRATPMVQNTLYNREWEQKKGVLTGSLYIKFFFANEQ